MDMDEDEDNAPTVFEHREYQTLLLEEAKKSNVILYLPTGSGKTYIAQMLIRHFGHELAMPYSKGGKRSFFLCTTQALLYQQGKVLQKNLEFSVGFFSGADAVDYWTDETWTKVLDKYQVIAFTAQILLNLLNTNRIQFRNISVLIFDECHHVSDQHCMKQILDLYANQYRAGLCTTRLMGLTATLLNSDVKGKMLNRADLHKQVADLERAFCGRVISSDTDEVMRSSTNPNEEFCFYTPQEPHFLVKKILGELEPYFCFFQDDCMDYLLAALRPDESTRPRLMDSGDIAFPVVKKPSVMKDLKQMYDEVQMQSKEHGLNAGNVTALIMMLAALREIQAADVELVASVLENMLTALTVMRQKCEKVLGAHPKATRYIKYNSPKIDALLDLLKNYHKDKRTLVFCQRRASVKMLYYLLRQVSIHCAGYENIKPDFMVGVSTHLVQNTKLAEFSKKQDKLVLLHFNKGVTNLLIATDVLEEGIDIQSCNMVIKFDPPQHTRSYVQSKGRARSRGSQYILMVNEKDRQKYLEQFRGFTKIEEALKEISKAKRLKRDVYDDKYKRLPEDADRPNIYYVSGLESASVSEASAPALVYQYCNSLQCDAYSTIAPTIYKQVRGDEVKGDCKVVLRMPICCPIYDEIHGDWIRLGDERIKLAFQNACFKTVQLLHKIGELTDELRPVNRFVDPSTDQEWFPNYEVLPEIDDPGHMVGTSRRKELYAIRAPPCLSGSPRGGPGTPCFMHPITLTPAFIPALVDTERKKVFTQWLGSGQGYAVITSKAISQIADFPLYERFGDLKVSIAVNTRLTLSQDEVKKLQRFQTYLFKQIIPDCIKCFMVPSGGLDGDDGSNDYLVVPIKPEGGGALGYGINWSLVRCCQDAPLIDEEEPSVDKRRALNLKPEDYLHNVVIPWYRHNAQRQPYLVTHISSASTSSPFPSSSPSLSYSGYFAEKYDIALFHQDQFMLDVKPVTSGLNFLSPRSMMNKRRKNPEDVELEEVLIPELVNLVSFPAPYWAAALFLPAVLYRMTALLSADHLRVQLALKSGLVQKENLAHDSVYAPLRRSADQFLAGKKRTYTPLDLTSKTRSDTLERIRAAQVVDDLALELLEIRLDEADTSDLDPGLCRRMQEWNIEKDLDEVTIFDVVLNERKMSKVNVPLFTKATQAGTVFKKVEYKPYELIFKPAPEIHLLTIQYDPNTCKGPSQSDFYEALTAHSASDIVNYERLETLGDALLKFGTTLALYTSLRTMDEGRLTLVKGTIVGNKNLYLAARKLGLPGYIKVHQFTPLHDWTPPRFTIPGAVKTIFNEAELPPALLLDIDLSNEQLDDGKLSETTEAKIYDFLANLDHENYLDPTGESDEQDPSAKKALASSSYNFLGRVKLSDKVVADVVEALTGAYLRSCGIEGALIFLQALGILPVSKVDLKKALFGKQDSAVRAPEARTIDPAKFIPQCADLEARIHYTFRDKTFLLEALSHPTYNTNRVTGSYQRFEFLGDAVMDFLVTAYLYENFTHLSPGDLTDIRSALVNNVTFASYSVRLGLHRLLLHDSPRLHETMATFAQNQEARRHEISDEILILVQETDVAKDLNGRVAEHVDVPKALGDVFEALIGAIYIDSGKDLSRVWYVLYNIMSKELDAFTRQVPKNPIRLLHELMCWPEFGAARTDVAAGRSVVPLTVTLGRGANARKTFIGLGLNKKNAKRAAAKLALRHVQ